MPDEKVRLPDGLKGDTAKSRDFGMNPDAKRAGPFAEGHPITTIIRGDSEGGEASISHISHQHELRRVRLDAVGLAIRLHTPVGPMAFEEEKVLSADAVLATAKQIIELVEGA